MLAHGLTKPIILYRSTVNRNKKQKTKKTFKTRENRNRVKSHGGYGI